MIIQGKRAIKVRSAFSNIPRCYQRNAHEPVPNHERVCHPFLFGEFQEFLCKPTEDVAVKCGVIRDPKAVEVLEVLTRQVRQYRLVYLILAEDGLILCRGPGSAARPRRPMIGLSTAYYS